MSRSWGGGKENVGGFLAKMAFGGPARKSALHSERKVASGLRELRRNGGNKSEGEEGEKLEHLRPLTRKKRGRCGNVFSHEPGLGGEEEMQSGLSLMLQRHLQKNYFSVGTRPEGGAAEGEKLRTVTKSGGRGGAALGPLCCP